MRVFVILPLVLLVPASAAADATLVILQLRGARDAGWSQQLRLELAGRPLRVVESAVRSANQVPSAGAPSSGARPDTVVLRLEHNPYGGPELLRAVSPQSGLGVRASLPVARAHLTPRLFAVIASSLINELQLQLSERAAERVQAQQQEPGAERVATASPPSVEPAVAQVLPAFTREAPSWIGSVPLLGGLGVRLMRMHTGGSAVGGGAYLSIPFASLRDERLRFALDLSQFYLLGDDKGSPMASASGPESGSDTSPQGSRTVSARVIGLALRYALSRRDELAVMVGSASIEDTRSEAALLSNLVTYSPGYVAGARWVHWLTEEAGLMAMAQGYIDGPTQLDVTGALVFR